ncbi:MAG: DUF4260 domain-containing protein [Hyphomicrobiaceae bacterium]
MTRPVSDAGAQGSVKEPVRLLLRLEGLTVTLTGLASYVTTGRSWWLMLLFGLAPDLSFLAYLGGSRAGAAAYNLAHTYVGAIVVAMAGLLTETPLLTHIALIWLVHIGVDRALGYGLKFPDAFTSKHLGTIGRVSS